MSIPLVFDDLGDCFSNVSCLNDQVFFFPGEKIKTRRTIKRLFGVERNVSEYYGLTGALGQTQLFIGVWEKALYLEYYEHEVFGLTGSCLLSRKQDRLVLVNRNCRILAPQMRQRGIGFLWFFRQKAACELLGIDKIVAFAARSTESCGYYALPRYGFNAVIPREIRSKLPKNLRSCRTVLNLFETPMGRHWWQQNGISLEVVFDLSANSPSQKAFAAYRD